MDQEKIKQQKEEKDKSSIKRLKVGDKHKIDIDGYRSITFTKMSEEEMKTFHEKQGLVPGSGIECLVCGQKSTEINHWSHEWRSMDTYTSVCDNCQLEIFDDQDYHGPWD